MSSRLARVECMLSDGMFDNEYAVEIDLFDGEKVSLFADRALVRPSNSPSCGYLQVSVVKEEPQGLTLLLPSEAFETGSRWIQVSKERVAFNANDFKQCRNSEFAQQRPV